MLKPRPRDGRLRWRQQHQLVLGGVLGTSRGTLVAVPKDVAVQAADEGPDLSPLGGKGRVAVAGCRLCKGRLVTFVSVCMWHAEGSEQIKQQ